MTKLNEVKQMEQTQNNETIQEQNTNKWLEQEKESITQQKTYEQLPSLIMEANKIEEIEIDFSKPFEKWIDPTNDTTKKIIPVIHKGEKKHFWLNVANPLYKELVNLGCNGQTKFKILRTGEKKQTRYTIVNT